MMANILFCKAYMRNIGLIIFSLLFSIILPKELQSPPIRVSEDHSPFKQAVYATTGRFHNLSSNNFDTEVTSKTAVRSTGFYPGYKFKQIAEIGEGYSPSINNLEEIVYQKYDSNGNPNIFSNVRGWLTFSTSGSARFPDINDLGEIVFMDNASQTPGPGPWTTWSSVRGWIGMGGIPSISDTGEIVYQDTQSLPRLLKSSTRGVLISDPDVNASNFNPEVNENGEVVYVSKDGSGIKQIFSTERGQITFLPVGNLVGTPTINNDGEIIYVAKDESGVKHLFSTVHGRITDASSFPEPFHSGPWTGLEEFGIYCIGVGYFPDINDKGQIVFTQMLAEGPYYDELEGEWYGKAITRPYLAEPVLYLNIDIMPFSYQNIIILRKLGLISVAILSTEDFDAFNEVDKTSLTFGKTGNEESLAFFLWWPIDANGDGYGDLFCYFWTEKTGFQVSDTEGILMGKTKDGLPIWGSDSVKIVIPQR